MSTLIKQMTKKENENTYSFKPRCIGIAGICPDCNGIVSWNSYHSRFECLSNNCCFEANQEGKRIWDNSMREENLRKIKVENDGKFNLDKNL